MTPDTDYTNITHYTHPDAPVRSHTAQMDPGPASPGLSDGPPRARSRGISFRSDHSTGSGSKAVDSPREKAQKGLWQGSTKANPMVAMNEAQPGGAYLSSLLYPPHPPSLAVQMFCKLELPPYTVASTMFIRHDRHVLTAHFL